MNDDVLTHFLEWNDGLRILLVGYGSQALTQHEHAEVIVKSLGKERTVHHRIILQDQYKDPHIPYDDFWDSNSIVLVSSDVILTMVTWDLVFIFNPTDTFLRNRGIFDEDYDGIARCHEFVVRARDAFQDHSKLTIIRENVARSHRTGLPQDLNTKTTDAIFKIIIDHVVDFVENF